MVAVSLKKKQKTQSLVRTSGSTLHWAVNSPQDILDKIPDLRLLAAATFFSASTYSRASKGLQAAKRAVRLVPPLNKALQYHRFAYGRPTQRS